MPRERCKSMPPWSRPHTSIFFKEVKDPLRLYMDDADLNLEGYSTVREIIRIPANVVLVLDETLVLKMRLATFDVETIVNSMRLAGTVVPVPHIYKYGHSGNCSFILMEYIHGYDLHFIKRSLSCYWVSVMSIVEKQVKTAIQRLADVGLSHHDLYPRNVLIDESWEIVAIVDWDYCTTLDPAREYLRRVGDDLDEAGNRDSRVGNPPHWNSIFLRHVRDRISLADLNEGWSNILHVPPRLRFPRQPSISAGNLPARKPRLVTQISESRRIAVMTSDTVSVVQRLVEACTLAHIPRASVCFVISDLPEQSSPFKDISAPFPISHLPPVDNVYDDWGKRWQHYGEELTRSILRERPDVIIQVGWTQEWGPPFGDVVTLPRMLTNDRRSRPIPLLWIRPALPNQDISPKDLSGAFSWAYHAFQRGEIKETGFTVIRLKKGMYKILQTRKVEMHKEESLADFEGRMLQIQGDIAVDVAKEFLEDVEPVAC